MSRRRTTGAVLVKDPPAEEAAILRMARFRTKPMLEMWARLQWEHEGPHPIAEIDILQLLASAYVQGVRDTAQATVNSGWQPPEGDPS